MWHRPHPRVALWLGSHSTSLGESRSTSQETHWANKVIEAGGSNPKLPGVLWRPLWCQIQTCFHWLHQRITWLLVNILFTHMLSNGIVIYTYHSSAMIYPFHLFFTPSTSHSCTRSSRHFCPLVAVAGNAPLRSLNGLAESAARTVPIKTVAAVLLSGQEVAA